MTAPENALKACTNLHVRAGSQKWHAARRTGIGASEIAMALGIAPSRWGSPTALYYRKTGELPDEVDNARLMWGRELESTILKRFVKSHPEFRDNPVVTGRLYRSNERPWQLATPDAVVFDDRLGFGWDPKEHQVAFTTRTRYVRAFPVVVQVKTGSKDEGWGEDGTDEIPVYYRAQVLQEMDVVGARVAWVPVLFNGRDYREYRVAYHERDVRILRARGAEFWQRVVDRDPPPVDALVATGNALRRVFGVEPDERVQVTGDLVRRLERAKRLTKRVKALHDRYENELRAHMGDAAVAMAGTTVVARRTAYTERRIDLDLLREKYPDLAEELTKDVPRTRLAVTTKELE